MKRAYLSLFLLLSVLFLLGCGSDSDSPSGGGGGGSGGASGGQAVGTFNSSGIIAPNDPSQYGPGCVTAGQPGSNSTHWDTRLTQGTWFDEAFEIQDVLGRVGWLQERTVISNMISPQEYETEITITATRGETFGLPIEIGRTFHSRCTITSSGGHSSSQCVSTDPASPTLNNILCNVSNFTSMSNAPVEYGPFRLTGGATVLAYRSVFSTHADITCGGQTWAGVLKQTSYKTNDLPSRDEMYCGGTDFHFDISYEDLAGNVKARMRTEMIATGHY